MFQITFRSVLTLALSLAPMAGWSQSTKEEFIESNLISILYHELGHAVIDLEALPVFGQEEDAADVFSIFLIDALFESESAESIAWDASVGFQAEAAWAEEEGHQIAWWDEHGPDSQRFYNTVCLFYGADPKARADFAENLGLPDERAEICPEEFDLAYDSWGPVLDEMIERESGPEIEFLGGPEGLVTDVIAREVADLNNLLRFTYRLEVEVADCDEANAFYDPSLALITMCSELLPYLGDLSEY